MSSGAPATSGLARARDWLLARRDWVVLVVVAAIMTFAFLTGKEPRGPTARLDSDPHYYYVYLPSLFVDGDLDLANQYAAHGNWYGLGLTPAGRPGNPFGIGPAIFSMPLFLLGRAIASTGVPPHDGFSRVEAVATLFASVLYTLGALIVVARFLRRHFPRPHADVASLAVLVAGPVVYYAVRQPGYAHPFATFYAALLVDVWDRGYEARDTRPLRVWLAMGAAFGAAVLARPQLATWGVLLVFALVDDLRRAKPRVRGRVLVHAALASVLALAIFAPQLWAWHAIYGAALLVPQGAGFMDVWHPAWTEVLFSARNGLFAWAPLYAFAAVGLVLAARQRVASALLVALLLQVWVNGAAWDWWAGGSFGGRRFDSTYVGFAYGFASVLAAIDARLRGESRWVVAQVGALTLCVLCTSHLALAMSYASSTVRIYGGETPAAVMRARIGARLGGFYGACSDVAMFPARAAFALRHGVSLHAYDEIAGVHHLDELFPGLNIREVPRASTVDLTRGALPSFVVGARAAPGGATFARNEMRMLIALNERRHRFVLRIEATDDLRASWNGHALTTRRTGDVHEFDLDTRERGINVLTLSAHPGAMLRRVTIEAIDP